jgi:hypothetical protein
MTDSTDPLGARVRRYVANDPDPTPMDILGELLKGLADKRHATNQRPHPQGGREQLSHRPGPSDIAKGFFIRPGQATEHKLGTKLREKGGPRRTPRPTTIYPYPPFSPMLVNCCAGSRNSTHIRRRSLPSASQQPDEPQMVNQEHTKTARIAASGGNFDE